MAGTRKTPPELGNVEGSPPDPAEPTVAGSPGYTDDSDNGLSALDELELRVASLEARIAEAARRALFHAERGGARVAPAGLMFADIGRALIEEPETGSVPDDTDNP